MDSAFDQVFHDVILGLNYNEFRMMGNPAEEYLVSKLKNENINAYDYGVKFSEIITYDGLSQRMYESIFTQILNEIILIAEENNNGLLKHMLNSTEFVDHY